MSFHVTSRFCIRYAFAFTLVLACSLFAAAQTEDFANSGGDPIKLFERGQDAHAKGDYKLALEFYEEAIKLRPEFPEAELQRGQALVSLNRREDAELAFRRAIELRPTWVLPYAKLGFLLARIMNRPGEAEPVLRKALELEPGNFEVLFELANLRGSAGDLKESIELWKRATAAEGATASTWDALGATQYRNGELPAAIRSFTRALAVYPANDGARKRRAQTYLALGDNEHALEDIRALRLPGQPTAQDTHFILEVAQLYFRAGRKDEALKLLDTVDGSVKANPEVVALRFQIEPTTGNAAEAAAALEKLVAQNPRDASLLAQLGALYRTTNPQRALDYYRRAADLEPRNTDYATGYAAALIQARRFAEATVILRRILSLTPDSYVVHANLATALYEQKRFAEALLEYEWVTNAKPEIAATYFFIATAHDYLGEYVEALAAYEKFLAVANVQNNQLEIEKVNLRLPVLRNQIKRGEGLKNARH
ncbi:MAG TPA: tetratricopeptide repeat protein [Pyrinomonadaceae bacterium]